jgi:hypothetical protein
MEKYSFDVGFMHICCKKYYFVEHTHEWKIVAQNWWIVVIYLLGFFKAKKINTKEIDFEWYFQMFQNEPP